MGNPRNRGRRHRHEVFNLHKKHQAPRLWLNRFFCCGIVMSNPKVWYNKFAEKDKAPGTRCMIRMYCPAPMGMRAFFNVWFLGPLADVASEQLRKEDQIVLQGALWTHDEKTRKEGWPAKRQFLSIFCQTFFQIPWRQDNYFKNNTIPVPRQEYHMMKMAMDALRQQFQVSPDILEEIGDEIPEEDYMAHGNNLKAAVEAYEEISKIWHGCDSDVSELECPHDQDEDETTRSEDEGDESVGPRGRARDGDEAAGPEASDDLEDGDVHGDR